MKQYCILAICYHIHGFLGTLTTLKTKPEIQPCMPHILIQSCKLFFSLFYFICILYYRTADMSNDILQLIIFLIFFWAWSYNVTILILFLHLNPSNTRVTFIESTRMQDFWKYLNRVMLVFIGWFSLSTLKWVCRVLVILQVFASFCIGQISHQQHKGKRNNAHS